VEVQLAIPHNLHVQELKEILFHQVKTEAIHPFAAEITQFQEDQLEWHQVNPVSMQVLTILPDVVRDRIHLSDLTEVDHIEVQEADHQEVPAVDHQEAQVVVDHQEALVVAAVDREVPVAVIEEGDNFNPPKAVLRSIPRCLRCIN
jgi:hypothetical protein